MSTGKNLIAICTLTISFISSISHAQNPQWLQYHTSDQTRFMTGDIVLQQWPLTAKKPPNTPLPTFKDPNPLFYTWTTPMAPDTPVWIAVDRDKPTGPYHKIWIDSNANGSLQDEKPHIAYRTDPFYAFFKPARLIFPTPDGPVAYHLYLEFYSYQDNQYLRASPACWYQGQITLGSKKLNCILIDHNTNGAFNDSSLDPAQQDRLRIGSLDNVKSFGVGRYLEYDNTLYKLKIAPDGAFIQLQPAPSVSTNMINTPADITEFSVNGLNGTFTRSPRNQTTTLPIGKYHLDRWTKQKTDENQKLWRLHAENSDDQGIFEVQSAGILELSIGSSIYAQLTATKIGDSEYSFNRILRGALGENLTLTVDNRDPAPPQIRIKNPDGSYDRTYTLEYG